MLGGRALMRASTQTTLNYKQRIAPLHAITSLKNRPHEVADLARPAVANAVFSANLLDCPAVPFPEIIDSQGMSHCASPFMEAIEVIARARIPTPGVMAASLFAEG